MVHAKLEELDIDAQERSKTNVLNDDVFSSLCSLQIDRAKLESSLKIIEVYESYFMNYQGADALQGQVCIPMAQALTKDDWKYLT